MSSGSEGPRCSDWSRVAHSLKRASLFRQPKPNCNPYFLASLLSLLANYIFPEKRADRLTWFKWSCLHFKQKRFFSHFKPFCYQEPLFTIEVSWCVYLSIFCLSVHPSIHPSKFIIIKESTQYCIILKSLYFLRFSTVSVHIVSLLLQLRRCAACACCWKQALDYEFLFCSARCMLSITELRDNPMSQCFISLYNF